MNKLQLALSIISGGQKVKHLNMDQMYLLGFCYPVTDKTYIKTSCEEIIYNAIVNGYQGDDDEQT